MGRRLISLILFAVAIFVWLTVSSSSARNFPEATKKRFRTAPVATPAGAVEKGMILLVEFPDVKHDVTRNFVTERFFDRLNRYVQEMSYGKVSIGGQVTEKWYRMPDSISQYKISSRNLEVDKSRVRKLIDADPKIPHLEGAAFDMGKRDSFHDEKNGIRVKLLKKTGDAYKILIEK